MTRHRYHALVTSIAQPPAVHDDELPPALRNGALEVF